MVGLQLSESQLKKRLVTNLAQLGIIISVRSINKQLVTNQEFRKRVIKALKSTNNKKEERKSKVLRHLGALQYLYTPKGGTERPTYMSLFKSRGVIKPLVNNTKNKLIKNNNAGNAIKHSRTTGHISNMLLPVAGIGGVNPSYLKNNLLNKNPFKYAIVQPTKNGKTTKVRAFALLHNNGMTRYLELIGGSGYGSALLKQIKTNAAANGKIVTLSAVNNEQLRQFYMYQGFGYNANLLKHYQNLGRRTKPVTVILKNRVTGANKNRLNGFEYTNVNGTWLLPMRQK